MLESLPDDVSRRVHRWGHVDDDEKWDLLRRADVVLYPSVVEGFGLVPFESAAAGTPCLTYDGTAPGELLAGSGAAVSSWDPAVWGDRVADVIDRPERAQALVDATLAVAAEHTWERCAEWTWSAIDHALASPARSRHPEDGGPVTQIAGDGTRTVRGPSLRFARRAHRSRCEATNPRPTRSRRPR